MVFVYHGCQCKHFVFTGRGHGDEKGVTQLPEFFEGFRALLRLQCRPSQGQERKQEDNFGVFHGWYGFVWVSILFIASDWNRISAIVTSPDSCCI